jgi:hypothetical protein
MEKLPQSELKPEKVCSVSDSISWRPVYKIWNTQKVNPITTMKAPLRTSAQRSSAELHALQSGRRIHTEHDANQDGARRKDKRLEEIDLTHAVHTPSPEILDSCEIAEELIDRQIGPHMSAGVRAFDCLDVDNSVRPMRSPSSHRESGLLLLRVPRSAVLCV